MGMDFNLVKAEAEKIHAAVVILSEEETLTKWRAIADRYGSNKRYSFQFWDELADPSIRSLENGWQTIKEFINPLEGIYLFFELADEKKAFFFKHGRELGDVLVELGCRDFYLVNNGLDFLICYNDHDVVLADGSAKAWLKRLGI